MKRAMQILSPPAITISTLRSDPIPITLMPIPRTKIAVSTVVRRDKLARARIRHRISPNPRETSEATVGWFETFGAFMAGTAEVGNWVPTPCGIEPGMFFLRQVEC